MKLSVSNTSPLVTGLITNTIGPYGNNDIVDDILDGSITYATFGLAPHQIDVVLDALLPSIRCAITI